MDENASTSHATDNIANNGVCCVCLNSYTFPVQLNCRHKLCYLCFKGISLTNKKCPLCRKNITQRTLNKPKFVKENDNSAVKANNGDFKWFYKGSNGWWLYDEQTNDFIENAYRNNQTECRISLIGMCYVVDFSEMMQFRENIPGKKRRVKRDVYSEDDSQFKGLAGISKSQLESLKKRKSTSLEHQSRRLRKS